MKKFTLIISMLSIVCANAFAQSYVIHKTDGTTVEYQASETDYIEFKEVGKAPNEAKAVDLGLSVKWANMNVGATKITDYGDYFAWGETETKDVYSHASYKLYKSTKTTTIDNDGFEIVSEIKGYTKYVTEKYSGEGFDGFFDNKTTLDRVDDAAYANWGGDWRMPTIEECNELRKNCKWEWATLNNVNGFKVTGLNGNWIFLPAARCYDQYGFSSSFTGGSYWSSTLHSIPYDAEWLGFISSGPYNGSQFRYTGRTVRPVSE